ncbi:MAG: hypothetical protein J7K84_04900, partial [Deltaproteobacteria bacterium]|nr:hypothetical protein [Deltaproteobacteria bacterium]
FIIIMLFSGIIAFTLPPVYLSESTILVEEQQIPTEFVRSTLTGYAEERLEHINQTVMSRSKLKAIIKKLNLYPDLKDKYTTEQILEKMRDDINMETIDVNIRNKRKGSSDSATIAFKLSFQGPVPVIVQKVTNILASLYIQEDIKTREKLASATSGFLKQELKELEKQVAFFENEISKFKEKHTGELPESANVNLQAISRFEMQLDRNNMNLRTENDKKIILKGQITNLDPLLPIMTEEGKVATNPKTRLKQLRLQLLRLQSTFSDKHPDIKKLKQEINELESHVGITDYSILKIKQLIDLKDRLASLNGKLGPQHPDVIRLRREIQTLSVEVDKLNSEQVSLEMAENKPDNPSYINLITQITSVEATINSLMLEKQKIKDRLEGYQRKLENAPSVERKYKELIRDYDTARNKYNDINHKLMEARVSQGMDKSQKGERFTITEPAYLPKKPYKPNRLAIILLGFVLAAGGSIGFAAIREAFDHSIRTADQLHEITGLPVFSVVPLIETDYEKRRRIAKKSAFILIIIFIMGVAFLLVDKFVIPLDILWITLQNKLLA